MRTVDHGIAILADLALVGLTAWLDGDKLLVGPKEKLTPELASHIREHKSQIIETLRGQAEASRDPEPSLEAFRHERFAAMQSALRRRGFHVLADKPEVVLALVEAAKEIAAKLAEGDGNE